MARGAKGPNEGFPGRICVVTLEPSDHGLGGAELVRELCLGHPGRLTSLT